MPIDVCPDCGKERAAGLCPRCVLKLGIDDPGAEIGGRDSDIDDLALSPVPPRYTLDGIGSRLGAGLSLGQTEADGAAPIFESAPGEIRPGGFLSGRVIAGRYTLLEVLGEGGMGTVYLADQSKPVKRRVALKLIKTGLDSRSVLARFAAERQALALMDHPNIARVYDGGTTAFGQPFFVMDLVDGPPITEYCDGRRVPLRRRLELFVAVCQAVQHAHQKGIIHRDLKPGNVLVTEMDGRPTPKVIDFGVAKATAADSVERSLALTGAIVGTPAYMSPEQADPSMDIDTRTDIYALGVILYELLAGSTPLDAEGLRRGAFLEMLRMVREVDPPTPSTKVGSSDSLSDIAARRDLEPDHLKRALKGDLDWIVMKALEKDRTRRYETANDFAADILRHLAHEPVRAAPPSRAYLLKKAVRRHLGAVVAASLVALTLVAGISGTTWGLIEARGQQRRAEAGEKLAGERTLQIEAEKKRAEAAAIDAVDQSYLATRNEVRAMRLAHESGWRSGALDRLGRLARLGSRKLDLVDLRSEAIACLAEVDVRIESTFAPADMRVWHLQFSPDGRTIAVNDIEKSQVRLRDLADNRELPPIPKPSGYSPFAFHPGGALALPGGEGRVTFHATAPGQPTFPDISGEGHALNLAFSRSGDRVAVAWGEIAPRLGSPPLSFRRVTVHETATGATLRAITIPADTQISYKAPLALSADGQSVATTGPRFEVRTYSVDREDDPVILGTLESFIGAIAFHPRGRTLAACGKQFAAVWDLGSRAEVVRMHPGNRGIWDLAFSPDGRYLATAGDDAIARLYDARTGRELAAVPSQVGLGLSVAFSPRGDRFAVGGRYASVLAIEGGHVRRIETSPINAMYGMVFDPVRPVLYFCEADRRVFAWSLDQDAARVAATTDGLACPSVLRFSPDGELVLGLTIFDPPPPGHDYSIRVWPRDDPAAVRRLEGPLNGVISVAVSASGRLAAAGSLDGGLYVWDFRSGKLLLRLALGAGTIRFLDDSRLLVAADDRLRLLSPESGATLRERAFPRSLESFVVAPDGKEALVGTIDGVIHGVRLPDLEVSRSRPVFQAPGQMKMAIVPDGSLLAASSDRESRVVLLDPRTLEPLAHIPGLGAIFHCLEFGPEGRYLAFGDFAVALWNLASLREELARLGLAWD